MLLSACTLTQAIIQAKRAVNYTESGDEDEEEDDIEPVRSNKTRGRALKRRRVAAHKDGEDDDFVKEEDAVSAEEGEFAP